MRAGGDVSEATRHLARVCKDFVFGTEVRIGFCLAPMHVHALTVTPTLHEAGGAAMVKPRRVYHATCPARDASLDGTTRLVDADVQRGNTTSNHIVPTRKPRKQRRTPA